MKALILAAGKGKRLEDLTMCQNKCMMIHDSRPLIEHSIERMARFDRVSEIVIVVGYRAEDIINHFGNRYGGKRIRYVIQRELRGLVHAMECAKETLEGDDFILLLGDEVMSQPRYPEFVRSFQDGHHGALLGAVRVADRDRIRNTYTFLHDASHTVFRLIEKPKLPLNDLMGTGNVIFSRDVFEFVDQTKPHPERGEKELPELLQTMIDNGRSVGFFEICAEYTNVNTAKDLQTLEDARWDEKLVSAK